MKKKPINENEITYVEPADYFPKEIWKKTEKQIKENELKEKDQNES